MRLLILINLCFLGITGSSGCIHQMTALRVQSGGSVTIPCSYSAPEEPNEDVQIIWEETNKEFCPLTYNSIFSPSGNVTGKYDGRLYRERDPNRKRTEYIKITELRPMDGPRFCCRMYNVKSNIRIDTNLYGTLLMFPDKQYVIQPDELMVVSGEEVIIPCYYSKDISDITHISWYYGDRTNGLCSPQTIHSWTKTDQHGRYSLVNFSQDPSLRIHNITVNDQQHYCCVISPPGDSIFTKQRTTLTVAEYQSSWDQLTKEITVLEGHSVNLPCSYTLPNGRYTERNIVRVNVYWRVGNVTGAYAYHPHQEMVHSTYIHRTYITGVTNLMIKEVTTADNTSFHCFVVVKLCAGSYKYEDKIEYGGGTRLIIIGTDDSTQDIPPKSNMSQVTLILVAYVAIKFFFVIVLVAVGCVYGRSKNTKRSNRRR